MKLATVKKIREPRNYFAGVRSDNIVLPKNIILVGRHRDRLPSHRDTIHHRFLLALNLSGPGNIIADGTRHSFYPGHCFLVFPHQYHHFFYYSENIKWIFMTFEMSSFEHLAPLRGNTVEINNKASEFIEMLTDIYNSSINGSANACTVTLLAGLLLNEVRKGKEINYEPSGGFMDEVNKYIYMNLKKQLKLSDIAARFSYSPSRFRAVYREAMGIPPGRYIREMRLHKAQEYLAGTSTRISKIATLCGYDSVYSFSHAFRDYTKFSPSEFRRKYSV